MSVALPPATDVTGAAAAAKAGDRPAAARPADRSQGAWGMALRSGRVVVGGGGLLLILLLCVATMPWTLGPVTKGSPPLYEQQVSIHAREGPAAVARPAEGPLPTLAPSAWFGYDML